MAPESEDPADQNRSAPRSGWEQISCAYSSSCLNRVVSIYTWKKVQAKETENLHANCNDGNQHRHANADAYANDDLVTHSSRLSLDNGTAVRGWRWNI
jgi:hypothetical protein